MFLNKDMYRREGAVMILTELSKLPKNGLITLELEGGDSVTLKRVK